MQRFRSLQLAFAYIRIPKLFLSLFFFPLLLSLLLVAVQLYVTLLYISTTDRDAKTLSTRIEHAKNNNPVKFLLFGNTKGLPPVQVCRWVKQDGTEVPPSPSCAPDRLDIALHVSNPQDFDISSYKTLINGISERLHVCVKDCRPDVVIEHHEDGTSVTHFMSIQGGLVLSLLHLQEDVTEHYITIAESLDAIDAHFGDYYFFAPGYSSPIKISGILRSFALMLSIASLVVIALWLAVKAHRKVLDYFSKSGALLPMVAAIGKREFYGALWILTLFRVVAFLLASLPMLVVAFALSDEKAAFQELFSYDAWFFTLWLLTLIVSFGLASIVASIADLKHRHQLFSFVYRYVPVVLSFAGLLFWAVSFLIPHDGMAFFRILLTALPVIGSGPVLVSPLFPPPYSALFIHGALTLLVGVFLLRQNSRWFAAHLEAI
ncbi:MAG: hypothetical protein KDD55_01330 [Bdellovibrionales bacterium]|nr:hypothetical protein [Bdellovibrionales bacterium]